MTARGPAAEGPSRSFRHSLNAFVQNRTLVTDSLRFYYSIQGIVKKNTDPQLLKTLSPHCAAWDKGTSKMP